MLPSGLRDAAETVGHLAVQRTPPTPMNDEFVGITKYVMESFHDLLAEELELPSGSDSSRGSHHPSRECFTTGVLEGHVKSIREVEATPVNNLGNEVKGETIAPPRMWVEQLKA